MLKPPETYIHRIKTELSDLLCKAEKLDKLIEGVHSRVEIRGDIGLIEAQLKLMTSYADILKARLIIAYLNGGVE